jgi:cell wall-associated NlpC family hydrolase
MLSRLSQLTLVAMLVCALIAADPAAASEARLAVGWVPKPRTLARLELWRPAAAQAAPLGLRIVRFARRLLGVPYRWGGDTPASGFDCSGLVRFVYAHFGLRLPHSSYSDFALGASIARRALRPGDLVFFDGLGHVGIYVGANRFIEAPHSGGRVQITSLASSWYAASYDGARRIVRAAGAPV